MTIFLWKQHLITDFQSINSGLRSSCGDSHEFKGVSFGEFCLFCRFYIHEKVNEILFLLVKVEHQITVFLTSYVEMRSCLWSPGCLFIIIHLCLNNDIRPIFTRWWLTVTCTIAESLVPFYFQPHVTVFHVLLVLIPRTYTYEAKSQNRVEQMGCNIKIHMWK